jgi:hypothetical protein
VSKVSQRGQAFVGLDDDVPAFAAIAAVRAAMRHELLATKANGTVSTRTRDYVY